MELRSGARIGSFEILGPLGAGGMGEVHRARDTRLGREVAIKALPAAVSRDAERRARFDREARLLASLNHPGIGAIYGVEDTPEGPLLILELIAGTALDEVIARGPLPVGDALSIARQIADAVAYAHASGVVHRDLKPANVKWTPDGRVKVLDFGIAKALSPDSGVFSSEMSTVTPGVTAAGVIVGTPNYMSPEQARAESVDRRSDIWSFGCILYEMLTGRRAFHGRTATDTLVAVLERQPDWAALPPGTPPPIRTLLRRCLQRDRDRRLHDMADARIEIEDVLTGAASSEQEVPRRKTAISAIELAAITVIGGGTLLNLLILNRSIPVLVSVFTGYDMVLSFPLRLYIASSNIVARLAPWVALVLVLVGVGLHVTRRKLPAARRPALLVGLAAIGGVMTTVGLYSFAQDGLFQAVRMSVIAAAPAPVLERDIAWLYLAAGQPERAIALLDPKGTRDDFASPVRFGSPGEAFLLAESYRAANNTAAARRLYMRAQEAATKFDEGLTETLLADQIRWQNQFGRGLTTWLPATSDLRRLPDLIRAVSQQRLDQLPKP